MTDPDLTPALIAPLLDLLAQSDDEAVRLAACTALAALPLAPDAADVVAPAVEAVLGEPPDDLGGLVADELGPAIAAAAAGDRGPLAALLEQVDGDDPPELLLASPRIAYAALGAHRPLPAAVGEWLVGRLEDEELGPNAKVLIRALTDAADADETTEALPPASPEEASAVAADLLGQPLELGAITSEQLRALQALDADRGADVVGWTLTEARRLGIGEAFGAYSDHAVNVIAHLPAHALQMGDIYDIARRGPRTILDDTQLGWVAARSGPRHAVAALAPLVATAGDRTSQLELLDLIGDSARPVAAGPPLLGPPPGLEAVEPPARPATPWSRTDGRVRGRRSRGRPAQPPPAPADAGPAPPATRTAWPHLLCDEEVVVATPFTLEVGLRAEPLEGVGGTGALSVPDAPFDLDVEVSVDGFTIEAGTARFTLPVRPAAPYPVTKLTIAATRDASLKDVRAVGVSFWVDDTLRGYAHRLVRIVGSEQQLGQSPPPVAAPAESFSADARTAEDDSDVTIVVSLGDDAAGTKLLWTARSRMAGIDAPPSGLQTDLGAEPKTFARQISDNAGTAQDPLALFDLLDGNGRDVARKIPPPIREMLACAVGAAGERPPSVLIYTAEPHVPWELAVIEELPGQGRDDLSPFLGARVALGRWPHGEPPPPRDPLAHRVHVTERAIVRGVYDKVAGWPKLDAAEAEAEGFHDAWPGSAMIDAEYRDVRKLIRGDPPADLLHFAMHGQLSDRASQNGLVLIRRTSEQLEPLFLQPSQVRAAGDGLKRRPFVFLNACQIGAGQQVLGDHGGMAVAFLAIGAAAVVAPVWSVKDTVASKAAESFYAAVLGDEPVPVAETLRAARARFTEATIDTDEGLEASTYLAYSYFGHPKLTMTTEGR